MRFARKLPNADKELSARLVGEGWNKLNEPKSLSMAALASLPFLVLGIAVCYLLVSRFNNDFAVFFENLENGSLLLSINLAYVLGNVLLTYLFVVLHELLHLVFVPNFLKSSNTVFGITLWGGFVSTTEQMTKRRFMLISITPFVLLSLVLPALLGIFKVLTGFLAFLALLNAAASCVDLLNVFLIAVQVPNKSSIVNNGFETFHKIV